MRRAEAVAIAALAVAATAGFPAARPLAAQESSVRAVLFFSPTCPHCEQVMLQDLPSLLGRHGDRLTIIAINAATREGNAAYEEAVRVLAIPPQRSGVPLLVVGDASLVGSGEIPERFPGIVDRGLAAGGIDWPELPLVRAMLVADGHIEPPEETPEKPVAEDRVAEAPAAGPIGVAAEEVVPPSDAAPEPAVTATSERRPDPAPSASDSGRVAEPSDAEPEPVAAALTDPDADAAPAVDAVPGTPAPDSGAGGGRAPTATTALSAEGSGPMATLGPLDRFWQDPVGNGLSVLVLGAMLGVLAWSVAVVAGRGRAPHVPEWLIPGLAIAGLLVAGYLSWVETTGSDAVCGPVGDCNTVQQSEYARVFGMLPVGVLGLVGYLLMLGAWWVGWRRRRARGGREEAGLEDRLLWGLAIVATGFSAWLTFLEPFVIGATCAWCLTSALLVTGILVASSRRARLASRDRA
jgi:uncharacterized membrane protein